MRKNIVIALVAVMITAFVLEAGASSGGAPVWNKKTEKPSAATPAKGAAVKPGTAVPGIAAPTAEDLARQRSLLNMKRSQIDNTVWEVELIPISGKGKNKKDIIRFADKKVTMDSLAKEGFAATNFSLSMRNNKKLVWETMQKKDADIIFFKGELTPELDSMSGVISFQRLKAGTQDFSFRSTAKKEAAPE